MGGKKEMKGVEEKQYLMDRQKRKEEAQTDTMGEKRDEILRRTHRVLGVPYTE